MCYRVLELKVLRRINLHGLSIEVTFLYAQWYVVLYIEQNHG